jgi:hypothetical protein
MNLSTPELRTPRSSSDLVVAPTSTGGRRPVVRPGVLASAAAAAATTTTAAIASASGVSFADRSGSSIPVSGFGLLTVAFCLLGVALAAILARRASRPRATFVRTTVVLVGLSIVPDLVSGFGAAATLTLICTHLLAAAIVIPTLAVRLPSSRIGL